VESIFEPVFTLINKVMENANATETALRIKKKITNKEQQKMRSLNTQLLLSIHTVCTRYSMNMQYIMWVSKSTASLNGLFQRGPGSKFVLL